MSLPGSPIISLLDTDVSGAAGIHETLIATTFRRLLQGKDDGGKTAVLFEESEAIRLTLMIIVPDAPGRPET